MTHIIGKDRNKMGISSTVLYAKIAKGKRQVIKVASIRSTYSKGYYSGGNVVRASQIWLICICGQAYWIDMTFYHLQ